MGWLEPREVPGVAESSFLAQVGNESNRRVAEWFVLYELVRYLQTFPGASSDLMYTIGVFASL